MSEFDKNPEVAWAIKSAEKNERVYRKLETKIFDFSWCTICFDDKKKNIKSTEPKNSIKATLVFQKTESISNFVISQPYKLIIFHKKCLFL